MARPKKNTALAAAPRAADLTIAPIPVVPGPKPIPAGEHDLAPRLSVPVSTDKTRIAYDRLQDKTREQLRTVLSDPALFAQLGIAGDVPAVVGPDGTPPELCGYVWDLVSVIFMTWAKREQYTPAQVQTLAFTDKEKETLNPLTAKLIDKWLPGGFGKYQDEMALGLTVTMIISGKLTALAALRRSTSTITNISAANPPAS